MDDETVLLTDDERLDLNRTALRCAAVSIAPTCLTAFQDSILLSAVISPFHSGLMVTCQRIYPSSHANTSTCRRRGCLHLSGVPAGL